MRGMSRPFAGNQIPFLTKFFLFTFLVLIGYALIAHSILIPRSISTNYDQQLTPNFGQLNTQFKALSKSTELAVYSDPYTDLQSARTDLLATQKLIAETELTIRNYEQQADILPASPLAPYSESYKKAQVTRDRTKGIFQQSREVLGGYKDLNTYLLRINSARIVLQNNTADINALNDLNRLAGQGDIIAKRAVQLRGAIDNMEAMKPPVEFRDYHAALIASFTESQTGLALLSKGLAASDDVQINAGARVMEQAIQKYEGSDSKLFEAASKDSAILNETGMLADKADSLQPFLEQ